MKNEWEQKFKTRKCGELDRRRYDDCYDCPANSDCVEEMQFIKDLLKQEREHTLNEVVEKIEKRERAYSFELMAASRDIINLIKEQKEG